MKKQFFVYLMLLTSVFLISGCSFNFNFLPDNPTPAPADDTQKGDSWKNRKYGLQPDKPDKTAKLWSLPVDAKIATATKVDLRPLFADIYDQGQLGSCSANAFAAAIDYVRKMQGQSYIRPSRLFIYYNERDYDGSVSEDAGATLQAGVKTLLRLGTCTEQSWNYDINKFAVKPPQTAYVEALNYQALSYAKIPKYDLNVIRQTLANHFPIVFGFYVYESFETATVAKTGICPMPKPGEKCLGGHAVVLVGYDDTTKMFLVRNSWGPTWGIKGYFWMPYAFLQKYGMDFWVIKKME